MNALRYDFRSDTVTKPSPGMRAAMAAAEVGDDVFGDDPTVNRLEAVVAERLGKAAGVFMPSGTQSNLAALMAHCGRGDEYIAGQQAHCYVHEQGGAAVLGASSRSRSRISPMARWHWRISRPPSSRTIRITHGRDCWRSKTRWVDG